MSSETLRYEYLNEKWFMSIEGACESAEAWRRHSIEHRPHNALGNSSPRGFDVPQAQQSRAA